LKRAFQFNLQNTFFFLLLIVLTISFYRILYSFWVILLLSVLLSHVFWKPYKYFYRKIKRRKLAAFASVGLIFSSVVIPFFLLSLLISIETTDGYAAIKERWPAIQKSMDSSQWTSSWKKIPLAEEIFGPIDAVKIKSQILSMAKGISDFLFSIIQKTFVNLSYILFGFALILYFTYYLFLDGEKLLNKFHYLLPLKDADEKKLISNITRITDATIYGIILIGILEGIFGALLLSIIDIPSPLLWGVGMMILSMLPLVGTNALLLPIAIYKLAIGNYFAGFFILIIGSGGILVSQNILRPLLVGNRSGMHPVIIVISSLGGIAWLGLIGFLVGPLIGGLFVAIWEQFGKKFDKQLRQYNR